MYPNPETNPWLDLRWMRVVVPVNTGTRDELSRAIDAATSVSHGAVRLNIMPSADERGGRAEPLSLSDLLTFTEGVPKLLVVEDRGSVDEVAELTTQHAKSVCLGSSDPNILLELRRLTGEGVVTALRLGNRPPGSANALIHGDYFPSRPLAQCEPTFVVLPRKLLRLDGVIDRCGRPVIGEAPDMEAVAKAATDARVAAVILGR